MDGGVVGVKPQPSKSNPLPHTGCEKQRELAMYAPEADWSLLLAT